MSMNANGAAPIPMDESLRLSIATDANASVLQRMDGDFLHVLTSASHVSMYRLEEKNWERYDVEGSTFIYQRRCHPSYRIFCLNRRSTDNFCLDIVAGTTDIEVVNEKMIAFPGPDGDIFGMWFYVAEELQMFHQAFTKIVQGIHVPPLPRRHSGNTNNNTKNSNSNKKESPKKKARNPSEPNLQKQLKHHRQATAPPPLPQPAAVPPSGFSLQRFFPNLQPTANGVIGAAIPAKAKTHDVSLAESTPRVNIDINSSVQPGGETGISGITGMSNVSFGQYSASVPLQAPPNGRSERAPISVRSEQTGNANNAALINLFQGKPMPMSMPAGSPSVPLPLPPVHNIPGVSSVSGPSLVPNQAGVRPIMSPVMNPPIVPGVANGGVGHSMPMMLPGAPPGMPGIAGMHPAHFQAFQAQQQHAHMAYLAHQRAQQQGRIPNHVQPMHMMPNINMNGMNNINNNNGDIPNGKSNGHAGDAILGMLKPNSVAKSPEKRNAVAESARDIGTALSNMKLDGVKAMNKAEFRAVVQRMLSDKKLFDNAYGTYISIEKK